MTEQQVDRPPSAGAAAPPERPQDAPAPPGRLRRLVELVRRRVVAAGDWAEANVPIWWLLRDAWDRYWRLNGAVLAGHLAFRTFVWLLPVAFLVVAAAGFLRSQGTAPDQVIGEPLGLGQALGQSLRQAGDDAASSWYHVAWVSTLGVLMGSLGLYSGLHYVFLQLWEIPYRKVERRTTATLRFTGGFVIVLAGAFGIRAVRNQHVLLGVTAVVVLLAIVFAAFVGLAWLLPRRSTGLASLVPGAVVGAIGVAGLQLLGAFYLPSRMASFSATYGVLGVAATFIFYLYLVGSIVVVSTIVDSAWWDHHHPGEVSAPSARSSRPAASAVADVTNPPPPPPSD
ncbi:MAG: YhjD/YihY/BrkB family envelope integrity protein [Acidimicrobiales bacterium]